MQLTKIIKKIQLLHSTSTETPTSFLLAREMINLLPVDWQNPNLKILDPGCGRGTFLLALMERLESEGHSRKHIITNMLWGIDISPVQSMIARKALSLSKNVKSNIFCDDTLTRKFNMKFDVVVGNPPYQDPKNDKRMLWNQIVDKMSEVTKDNGYIAVVTPSTWLTASTNIHNSYRVFEEKQVEEAVIFDKDDSPFEEGTTVSYSIIKNIPRQTDTNLYFAKFSKKTKDLVGTVNIAKEKFWPGQLEPINLAIHNKLSPFAKIEFIKSCEFHNQGLKKKQRVSDTQSKDFPYTHHVSAAITRYTSVKFSKHDTWKVMVPLTSTIDKAVIDNNCGHGEDMLSLYVKNEDTAKNIKAVFNTKFYKFIGKLYKNGRNQPLQNLFPVVDFTRTWTDSELYQLVGLTQEEIDYVEANVK
jgi:SAM-dependent methyltransferase